MALMSEKQLLAVVGAIAFALGGGSGTLAGDYSSSKKVEKIEDRLRQVETDTAVTKKDVQYIKEKVDTAAEASKKNGESLIRIERLIIHGNRDD